MAREVHYCSRKECKWSESSRLAARKLLIEQPGAIEEIPIASFFKSKLPKQSRCNETLCQKHYFAKRLAAEVCKMCDKIHDYEEINPLMQEYAVKKSQIIQWDHNSADRYWTYLQAYLYQFEAGKKPQYKQAITTIEIMKKKAILPYNQSEAVHARVADQDNISLKQLFELNRIPKVEEVKKVDALKKVDAVQQMVKREPQNDALIAGVSGCDRTTMTKKGIDLLMKKFKVSAINL